MNIVRVTRAFIPLRDGISHHTYYLSKYQVALGHRVTVLQPHHSSGIREGIHVVKIPLGRWTERYGSKHVTALFAFRSGLKIRELHARTKVDVIHAHGDIIEAFILSFIVRGLGIPLVMTMHSGLSRKRYYRTAAPFIWRRVNEIIGVSPEIIKTMERWSIPPERLYTISSGIEFQRFARACEEKEIARRNLGIPTSAFVVLGVGRLHPMKGFRYLIEAASTLSEKSVLVYIVGGGPLESDLRSRVKNTSNVILTGSQPQESVIKYLVAADVFVLPSIDLPGQSEGTPTALMEAMAAGLPVVITDSGGGKYLVRNGENGFVVPQANAPALATAIRRLLENPELRTKMSVMNREIAKSKDWRLIADQVCRVYERAISRNRASYA